MPKGSKLELNSIAKVLTGLPDKSRMELWSDLLRIQAKRKLSLTDSLVALYRTDIILDQALSKTGRADVASRRVCGYVPVPCSELAKAR